MSREMLDDKEKIEEAHGLWELAVVRLIAFLEAGATDHIPPALACERNAFRAWNDVSDKALGVEPGKEK